MSPLRNFCQLHFQDICGIKTSIMNIIKNEETKTVLLTFTLNIFSASFGLRRSYCSSWPHNQFYCLDCSYNKESLSTQKTKKLLQS